MKVVGLLFVATTRINASPSLVLELLQRIARVIKDYLGVLNEDSLRRNFVLVYELLDEVIVSLLSFPYSFSGFDKSTTRFALAYFVENHLFFSICWLSFSFKCLMASLQLFRKYVL